MTAFLEQLVGEPIDARVRHHESTRAESSNELHVEEGRPLLFRAAELEGRVSGQPYVYAETILVPSRLPGTVRLRLGSGSDPIGRVLGEEGIAVTRHPLDRPDPISDADPSEEVVRTGDFMLARTYRVDAEGTPVMLITEWFLSSLQRFLPRQ